MFHDGLLELPQGLFIGIFKLVFLLGLFADDAGVIEELQGTQLLAHTLLLLLLHLVAQLP